MKSLLKRGDEQPYFPVGVFQTNSPNSTPRKLSPESRETARQSQVRHVSSELLCESIGVYFKRPAFDTGRLIGGTSDEQMATELYQAVQISVARRQLGNASRAAGRIRR